MADLDSLNNVTTGDAYDVNGATISDPQSPDGFVAIEEQITGAAVYYKVAEAPDNWSEERFTPPRVGVRALGQAWGIEYRSAVPGTPAQVTARMLTQAEVAQAGGLGSLAAPAYVVDSSGNVQPVAGGDVIPSGMVFPYAGALAPAGYVLCDGTEYDGTDPVYAGLWAVIGLTYGGSAQASFAVPDLRGRFAVGLGTNPDVDALGKNDGLAVAGRTPKPYQNVDEFQPETPGQAFDVTDKQGFLVITYLIKL